MWNRTSPNKPDGSWDHIAREMTQRQGESLSKEGTQTIHFQCTTQTKTIITRTILSCNHLCFYAIVCGWFDLLNVIPEAHHHKRPRTFDNGHYELLTPTISTSFGKSNARHELITRSKFIIKCREMLILRDSTLAYQTRRMNMGMQRVHTTSQSL